MRWVRLNIDFDDSPWLFVLSAESQLTWVKLICHCKRDGMNGRCKALSTIVAGKKWGIGEESITKLIQAAITDGAMSVCDGYWQLNNWEEYQQSDSTAAERMRKMRSKLGSSEPVTVLRDVTRNNRNAGRNTSRDIDIDIDNDNKELSLFVSDIKKNYPKRDGELNWKKAETTIKAIPIKERKLCVSGVIGYRQQCEKNDKIGTQYVKQATTFFNGEIWREYQPVKDEPKAWIPDTDWFDIKTEPGWYQHFKTGEKRQVLP